MPWYDSVMNDLTVVCATVMMHFIGCPPSVSAVIKRLLRAYLFPDHLVTREPELAQQYPGLVLYRRLALAVTTGFYADTVGRRAWLSVARDDLSYFVIQGLVAESPTTTRLADSLGGITTGLYYAFYHRDVSVGLEALRRMVLPDQVSSHCLQNSE